MTTKYEKAIREWNKIFAAKSGDLPSKPKTGVEEFDAGLEWLSTGSDRILDFGCGDGTLLFMCALLGTQFHVGIDLSKKAIDKANLRKEKFNFGVFDFINGGVEELMAIRDASMDGMILSNILDNLFPQDVQIVVRETHRLLKVNGKVLVKLNPYITEKQIEDWQIKIIQEDLLDDGFILFNKNTSTWHDILTRHFSINTYKEIFYEEQQQTNRLFLLEKTGD